mmetsp:Transcript_32405/g.63799  ORF Transcript_32405/g.63799 Transcript_32405/m.63799 type:complete len:125 (+) Transcript_32405:349-723(+)
MQMQQLILFGTMMWSLLCAPQSVCDVMHALSKPFLTVMQTLRQWTRMAKLLCKSRLRLGLQHQNQIGLVGLCTRFPPCCHRLWQELKINSGSFRAQQRLVEPDALALSAMPSGVIAATKQNDAN